MKKALLLIPFVLFAFTSSYLPNIDIDMHCDKLLHKRSFDICYSYEDKTPKIVIYKLNNDNYKNGYSTKNLKSKYGKIKVNIRYRRYGYAKS
jgi:DNA/RNA endonuclease G (NUC1)